MMLHERLKAIMTSRLDCTARMVLVVIASRLSTDDADRAVWLGADAIAAQSGASRRTVITTLQRLTAIGVLVEQERAAGAPVRRLIDWSALAAAESAESGRGRGAETARVQRLHGCEDYTPGVQRLHGEGVQRPHPWGEKTAPGECKDCTRSVHDPFIEPIQDHPLSDPPSASEPIPTPEVPDEPPEEVQVLAPPAASSATPCEVPQAPRDSGLRPEGDGEVLPDRVGAAGGAHAGTAAVPSIRQVAPPRWEDSDAWHAMAADYRTIAERLGGTIRRLDPSTTAGKALVTLAKSRRGEICAMRLRLVAAALTGEPTTAAAHACATRWAPRDAQERGWSATLAALTRLDGGTTCQAIDVEAEQVIAGDLALRLPRAALATVPSAAGNDPVGAPPSGLDARGVEALLNARRAKRAQSDAVLVVIDEPMMLEVRDADGG